MPRLRAAFLAAAVLAAPLPGQARDNVVMVNIDYFAESHRMTGENAARLAIATDKPEMYMAFGDAYFKQRFGADYAASIETEVARRMKAAPQRRR
jgi:hypothetical protein